MATGFFLHQDPPMQSWNPTPSLGTGWTTRSKVKSKGSFERENIDQKYSARMRQLRPRERKQLSQGPIGFRARQTRPKSQARVHGMAISCSCQRHSIRHQVRFTFFPACECVRVRVCWGESWSEARYLGIGNAVGEEGKTMSSPVRSHSRSLWFSGS